MNIDKLNNNNIKNYYNITETNLEKGDILTGNIISEVENKYNIQLENNTILSLDKNLLKGTVGESVSFEVLDNKNSIRQIIPNSNQNFEEYNPLQRSATVSVSNNIYLSLDENIDTQVISNTDEKSYSKYLYKNRQTSTQENIINMSKIKNSISHISNTTVQEDIQKFLNNGLNPNNVDITSFNEVLKASTGIDLENSDNSSEENTLKEIKEEQSKYIKMDLNMNGADEEAIFNFEEILDRAGLPITQKNLDSLGNVQEKINTIHNMGTDEIFSILRKGGNISLEDLYTTKHNSIDNMNLDINLGQIKNLDGQIENIFNLEGIQPSQENISTAKDFIKNGLEITKENFDKYEFLENLEENLTSSKILENATYNILNNKNIFDINIFETSSNTQDISSLEEYKEILDSVKVEHIQSIINQNKAVNLKSISDEVRQNIDLSNIQITDANAISERLNLARIQMKMTSEVMYTIYEKGINIDTKPLKDVISTLENIEEMHYKKALELTKTPQTVENVSQMKEVFSTLQSLYPNNVYYTFKEISENSIDFSLGSINNSLKAKNIFSDFETFKTLPNRAFGDSINKISSQFETLLEENGFDITPNNIKALKILSLNEMDFNEENILKVKIIDEKINYIANNLHPLTVSKMLKESFNPMEKDVDEVIKYIERFADEFGQTSKEKIAEQILEIDKENKLSKEERDAIVSVYKMLNRIEKGDSAAIGNILKSEKNITFENLLNASKIYDNKRRGIDFDKTLDENTGELINNPLQNSIKNTIERGLEEANKEYNEIILKEIVNYASPEKIQNILESSGDSGINIENMLDMLKSDNKVTMSETNNNSIVESIRNLENVSQDIINYLVKNDMPLTINNINVLESILENNIKPSNVIEDFKNDLFKRGIDFGETILTLDNEYVTKEQALETVENLANENSDIFDEIIELEELDDIKYMILKNQNVSSNIKFLQDNNYIKNGFYSLPLKLSDGKVSDLNMFILNDKALNDKNVSLYLNFNNKDDKNIEAYVSVSDNGNRAIISTDTEEGFKNIKQYEEDVLNILNKFNIIPDELSYKISQTNDVYSDNFKLEVEQQLKNIDNYFNISV